MRQHAGQRKMPPRQSCTVVKLSPETRQRVRSEFDALREKGERIAPKLSWATWPRAAPDVRTCFANTMRNEMVLGNLAKPPCFNMIHSKICQQVKTTSNDITCPEPLGKDVSANVLTQPCSGCQQGSRTAIQRRWSEDIPRRWFQWYQMSYDTRCHPDIM